MGCGALWCVGYHGLVESLEDMRRQAALGRALRSRDGVTRFPAVPVAVRAITGQAIAHTATQVLVQWETHGEYHVRWEDKWQVKRLDSGEARP